MFLDYSTHHATGVQQNLEIHRPPVSQHIMSQWVERLCCARPFKMHGSCIAAQPRFITAHVHFNWAKGTGKHPSVQTILTNTCGRCLFCLELQKGCSYKAVKKN